MLWFGANDVGGGLLLCNIFLYTLSVSSYSNNSGDDRIVSDDDVDIRGTGRIVGCCSASLGVLGSLIGRGRVGTILNCLSRGVPMSSLPIMSRPIISIRSAIFISGPKGCFDRGSHRGLGRGCNHLFQSVSTFCRGCGACQLCVRSRSCGGSGGTLTSGVEGRRLLLDVTLSRCGRIVFSVLAPVIRKTGVALAPVGKGIGSG